MNGTPSGLTVPTDTVTPVRDRAYWTNVIHNAAKVTPDSPRYAEARQVSQIALDNLDTLMHKKSAAETPAPVIPQARLGAAMNAFQGLTLGFGDEALGGLSGLGTLLTGGGLQQAANRVQQTQEGFREQISNFRAADPVLAIGSDIAGTAINPLNRVLGPLTKGLGPVAQGAVYGTTIGGARGLGEGTGSIGERLPGAGLGAATGLLAGSLLGKAIKSVGPTIGKLAENTGLYAVARKALGKGAAPAEIENTVEAAIRSKLAKLKVPAEDIERAVQSWKQTGELSLRALAETHPPAPPPPPTVRPGETIQPTENLDKPTFQRRGATIRQETNNPLTMDRTASLVPPQTMPTAPHGEAARNAYNIMTAAGQTPEAAKDAASRAAGTYSNWDPRQALLLALLLGHGQNK